MGVIETLIVTTTLAGVVGTGLGGLIGAMLQKDSNRTVSLLLSFAGGVMLSVVCFDLVTEAIETNAGVCSVPEVVDWYGKDPYNKKAYCIGLVYALKDGQKWFSESMKTFSYPVFMTHGEKDGLVGMDDSVIFFKNAASKDKTLKVYGNLFHEILNEYCKDDVIADMIRWMDARI